MNAFVIPSWYPTPRWGLSGGSFLHEFVRAMARNQAQLNLHVSLWGQGDLELSSARWRVWRAQSSPLGPSRPARVQVSANLVEWSTPVWTWRHGLLGGNVGRVLAACRAQLVQARKEGGGMDLIHAHVSFPAGYIAMMLSRETGIPYLLTEHMSPFPFVHLMRDGRPVHEVTEAMQRAARVVAVSRTLAHDIREQTGTGALVIPNAVDEAFFTPGPAGSGGFTFLTVASLQPQKGVDDLLRAIAVMGSAPGVRFRIAGDGPNAAEYRALSEQLGVADRVTWLGQLSRESVRDEMRSCDAFVLTSRHESFGVVYAEAAACGKPVLATRCGGPEDIVNAINGVLVATGDVPAIAAAMGAMARREPAFDAAAIRADFEVRFSTQAVAGRYAALYAEVTGKR